MPRALSASFGVCMPGWEWVSGPLGFSMIMWFELPEGDDLCTFLPQANNSMNQNPCEIAGVLDVQCGPVGEFKSTRSFSFGRSRDTQTHTYLVLCRPIIDLRRTTPWHKSATATL